MINKKITKVMAGIALFSLSLTAFADRGFKIEEQNSSSVKLSWDKDETANYYQIIYGTNPDKKDLETEAIDTNNFEITGLVSGEKYYFSLIGLNASWEKVFESENLNLETSANFSNFALTKTKLVSEKVLRLTFSKKLDSEKIDKSEFKIWAVNDLNDILEVKNVTLVSGDTNSVDLEFSNSPLEGSDYKVVILAIYDESGNNIKFWVDSEWSFKWGDFQEISEVEKTTDLNSAWITTEEKKEEIKEETKEEVKEEPKTELKHQTSFSDLWTKNVENIAKNKDNLPETGPEVFLILLLALLIPAGIYKFKN